MRPASSSSIRPGRRRSHSTMRASWRTTAGGIAEARASRAAQRARATIHVSPLRGFSAMTSPPAFGRPDGQPFESEVGRAINRHWLADEAVVIRELLPIARLPADEREVVRRAAVELVEAVRSYSAERAGMDAFLREYDLGSQEGVILMCLAEALLRIPDAD